MNKLFLILVLVLVLVLESFAAVVKFDLYSITGTTLNNVIRLTPTNTLDPASYNGGFVGGIKEFTPVGGTITTNIVRGIYLMSVRNFANTTVLYVPDDNSTNVYLAEDLATELPAYTSTNTMGVHQIIAGNNITISPTTGVGTVTVNAIGGSSTNALSASDQLVVDNAVTNAIATNGIGITRSGRTMVISTNYDHRGSAAAALVTAEAYTDSEISSLTFNYNNFLTTGQRGFAYNIDGETAMRFLGPLTGGEAPFIGVLQDVNGNLIRFPASSNTFMRILNSDGSTLGSLNASSLASGTVALARISGLTTNQIAAAFYDWIAALSGGGISAGTALGMIQAAMATNLVTISGDVTGSGSNNVAVTLSAAGKTTVTNIFSTLNSNIVLNVVDFGAVPNTTNGNWAAFTAAISAQGKNHRQLVIPAGVYGFTNELTFTNSNIRITGLASSGDNQDPGGVILNFLSGSQGIIVTNAPGANSPNNITFENLKITGANNAATNNIGLKVFGASGLGSIDKFTMRDVTVNYFKTNVWWQEVSNSTFDNCDVSFASTNGVGFWTSGFCNGNNILGFLAVGNGAGYNMTGARLHMRGAKIILKDMGGPGMTSCIQFDGFYGSINGGNIEYYGGDIAPFKTIADGNTITLDGVQILAYAGDTSASFAFGSDGGSGHYRGDVRVLASSTFGITTNVGGTLAKVAFQSADNGNKIWSDVTMPAVVWNSGTLFSTNAIVGQHRLIGGTTANSEFKAGEIVYDYVNLKLVYCLQTNTSYPGFVQVDLGQYYKDFPSGISSFGNAYTNISQIYNAMPTFQNVATGAGIFASQTNVAGGAGAGTYAGAIQFRGYNGTFDFGQLIWFWPTGSTWGTVFELAPNGNSADHTPQRGLFGVWGTDGKTRIASLVATNATFPGTNTTITTPSSAAAVSTLGLDSTGKITTNVTSSASTSFTNAMLRSITVTDTSARIDLQPWTTNNTADLGFTLNLSTNVTLLQITNAAGWAGKQFKIEVLQTAQFTLAFNTNNSAGCATWIPPSFGQFITVPTNTIACRQFIYVEIGNSGTNAYILSQKNFVR